MKLTRFGLPASALVILSAIAIAGFASLGCGGGGGDGKGPTGGMSEGEIRDKVPTSKQNLRQLANAMLNYADVHNGLPPAFSTTADGKPGLSWRVLILPYIDQQALYTQFNLEEAWDSPTNKPLSQKMPAIFNPLGSGGDSTYYQVVVGANTPFEPFATVQQQKDRKKGVPISKVIDGTSNTLLIVEAKNSVLWTKPADLTYERGGPLPAIGGLFPEHTNFCMVDTSTFTFKQPTKTEKLHLLFMRDDREPVSIDMMGPY